MARRAHHDCPLCPGAMRREDHDRVYHAYQETREYAAAAKLAGELGVPCDEDTVRAHFQYHKVVQPPPRGYLKRAKALDRAGELPARLQDILVLVSRVRALSASQLAELFYWTGSEDQVNSARNACYRDLRRLILDDFVYRYYPAAVARVDAGSRKARQDQLSLYFLGRDGGPFVEDHERMELSRKDVFTGVEQLGDELRIMAQQEAAEVVCALARQAKVLHAQGRRPQVDGAPPLQVTFSPRNWFGRERVSMEFRDPLSGRHDTVSPSGLAALGLEVPERSFSVLAPFLYEYDAGGRPLGAYAQDLLGYVALARSGALRERFPQLPGGYFPPVIVVCRDMARVIALQEEMGRLLRKRSMTDERMPVVVITDEVTSAAHGLAGQTWLSLWDHSMDGRRYRLLEVLLHSCRPLVGALDAHADLAYAPGQAPAP